jgi:C-terminal processing protease CtpA/Prc
MPGYCDRFTVKENLMKRTAFFWIAILASFSLILSACGPATPTETPATPEPPVTNLGPMFQVQGSFSVSNDFFFRNYFYENAVALVDMHGFVIRDRAWEIPVDGQALGFMTLNEDYQSGTFDLNLPLRPQGEFNDVDNNGKADAGVQIFAVAYSPNIYGGPFSEGDDRSLGWPGYLATVITDSENQDEVIGGDLIVWASDDRQKSPTGFGADKKLFTADDPVTAIPSGYSLVNLDDQPFKITQPDTARLTLYEPKEIGIKDYSQDSYTVAFDKLFAYVKTNYAFNGIAGKEPDWVALSAALKPRVADAEKNKDAAAFYLALRDFTYAFKDGHVGLGGGEIQSRVFTEATNGGYGFAIRQLDDGKVVVIFVTSGGIAEQAGMKTGAEVTAFNDQPIAGAIEAVVPLALPQSTEWMIRYQQERYLLRAPLGTQASIAFTNPGEKSQTVNLAAAGERDSFRYTSIFRGQEPSGLPVDFKMRDSGIGYVRINSNSDDLQLTIHLFERALQYFEAQGALGLIIDMRYNGGGAPLGLAGFLTDQEIPLGQAEYYSEQTGRFEPEGLADKVLPNQNQYRFEKMVLLVGPACGSACESDAYSFSQVPGMIVVGQYPTNGAFGDVARGQFTLPEGFFMQFPIGRFILPDGSLFLEGKGVEPSVRVPIDETTVFSAEDIVLKYGEAEILGEPVTQAEPTPTPSASAAPTPSKAPASSGARLMSKAELVSAANMDSLENKASENYSQADLAQMDRTFAFTINLTASEPLGWAWGWCATSQAILDDNFRHIQVNFKLNDKDVPLSAFITQDNQSGGNYCRSYYAGVTDFPQGATKLITTITFDAPINDGMADYKAGRQIFEYTVTIK